MKHGKPIHWMSSLIVASLALLVACAPAAQPSPTAAPPKPAPTVAPAKPAAKPTEAPAAKPAEAKPAAKPAATAAPAKPAASLAGKNIRWAFTSPHNPARVYVPIIADKIKEMGGTVTESVFNGQDPAIKAILTGEADFLEMGLDGVAQVNAQGLDLRTLANGVRSDWVLIAPNSIKTPADLNGKRVGIHGPGTGTEQYVKATIQKYNVKPDVLVVPGAPARAQALMNGQLDATPARFNEVLAIEKARPGEFHVLISYAKDYPFYLVSGLDARKQFIDKDPNLVQAFVNVFAEMKYGIKKDKSLALKYLPRVAEGMDPKDAEKLVDFYFAEDHWNPEISLDDAKKTIQFLNETGAIKDTPAAETMVDLRFIENAMKTVKR